MAVPRPDGGTSSHKNEGAGFRELKALGDDPFYRVSLRDLWRYPVAFGPQGYFGMILQFVVEVQGSQSVPRMEPYQRANEMNLLTRFYRTLALAPQVYAPYA
jgi:hypothetical protein